ncbi:MAG TPA: hypothetical protein VIJ75_22460 [Hanamia sp.]
MAETYNTNLLNVATAYIRRLRVPVTPSSLKQQLNENPYFPSLGMLVVEAIIVLVFAERMDKKEIIKRTLWAILIGIFAIILKYINF